MGVAHAFTTGFLSPENSPPGAGIAQCGARRRSNSSLYNFQPHIPIYPYPSHQYQQKPDCQFLSPVSLVGSRADQGVPHLTTVSLGEGFLGLLSQQFLSICSLVSEVLLLLTSLFLVDLCLLLKKCFYHSFSGISGGRKIILMCSIHHLY